MRNKILINWGSYDVDNFGDLLFPFLVEHFLRDKYHEVVHVSPTGTRSRWADARLTSTIAEAVRSTPNAQLIIGGGNLLSYTTSSSINYVENSAFAAMVHSSFSLVPYVLFAKHGIPYAYNLVGVAKRIPVASEYLAKMAIDAAAFISCRDSASAAFLRRAGVTSPIAIGPDSAIDIARVFPRSALMHHYRSEAREKYGVPEGTDTAVIHLKKRYFGGQLDALLRIVTHLQSHGIHPVLIPLGPCHGDDAILRDSKLQIEATTVITQPELLMDILSILCISRYYIGSSLHGAIASLSYGNSVVVVADETQSGLRKFSGFLSQTRLLECLYPNWRLASTALGRHGLAVFGRLSQSTICVLSRRRNTWDDAYQSFHGRRRAPTFALDQTVERLVQHHFGI